MCWLPHRVRKAPVGSRKRFLSKRIPPTVNKPINFSCLPESALCFELKGAGLKLGKIFLSSEFMVRQRMPRRLLVGAQLAVLPPSNFGQFVSPLGADEETEPAAGMSSPWSLFSVDLNALRQVQLSGSAEPSSLVLS